MYDDPRRTGCDVRDMVRLMSAAEVSLRWKMGVAIVSRYSKWVFRSLSVFDVLEGPKVGREGLTVEEAEDERRRERPRSGRSSVEWEKSK